MDELRSTALVAKTLATLADVIRGLGPVAIGIGVEETISSD
jgi:hypothetical protein